MNKFILIIIFILVLVISVGQPKISSVEANSLAILINQQRIEYNLKPLKIDDRLNKSATFKACDLRDRNYWSHEDPDGKMSWYMFGRQGYYFRLAGENLAKNCEDNICISLWMNSPTHRENILKSDYKDIGSGECGIFKVVHFGSL